MKSRHADREAADGCGFGAAARGQGERLADLNVVKKSKGPVMTTREEFYKV